MTNTAPKTAPLSTGVGSLTGLSYGFHSREGDECVLRLTHDGWLHTIGHVWSGFECPWPIGSRRYPLDEPGRVALQAALDSVAQWELEIDEERDESGLREESMLQLGAELYVLPQGLREAATREAQRIVLSWSGRERSRFDELIVDDVTPERHVRIVVQGHGIAVRTTQMGDKRTEGIEILTDARWNELQATLGGLPTTPTPDIGAVTNFILVNFNGVPLRYVRGKEPDGVRAVHQLVLGQ